MAKAFSLKALLLSFTLSFFFSFSPKSAQADTLEDFLQGAFQLQTHENHKLRSSFNGNFVVGEGIEGSYQLIVNSQIDNRCGLGCQSAHQITGTVTLSLEGMKVEGMRLAIDLRLLSYDQAETLYLKWNDLSVSLEGLSEEDKALYETPLATAVQIYKEQFGGQWIHLDEEEWQALSGEETSFPLNFHPEAWSTDLLNLLENRGDQSGREILLQAVQGLVDHWEGSGQWTTEESQGIKEAAAALLESKLFYHFKVVSGELAGFERSILNRFLVAEAAEKIMKEVGGNSLSTTEKQELLDFLNKLRLSLWYRFDETGLIDVFAAYVELNDLERLQKFTLRYRQQFWGAGEARVPSEPLEAMTLEEMMNRLDQ